MLAHDIDMPFLHLSGRHIIHTTAHIFLPGHFAHHPNPVLTLGYILLRRIHDGLLPQSPRRQVSLLVTTSPK